MALTGIFLAGLTALLKSSSEIISKFTLIKDLNEYTVSWALRFFALPIMLVGIMFFGIPRLEHSFWMALAFDIPAGVASTVLYMKAIQASDISLMSPLAAISPGLVLLSSPFIVGEIPSVLGLIGIMTVTVGLYVLKLEKASKDWKSPFKSLITEKGSKFMLAMLIIYSISSPINKLGVESSSPVMYTLTMHIGQVILLTPLMIRNSPNWSKELRQNKKELSLIGLFSGAASIAQMAAYTFTLVVYVIAIKRSGILLTTLAGGLLFDEENTQQRVLGALIILLGLILVALTQA